MMDRRRLLLITQVCMAVAAATLGVLTILGAVTPWVLLLFTFVMGLTAIMNDPAWQAITPEIISAERHASAVTLNSAGYNVARAAGPALGGWIIAAAGSGIAFLMNAASFLGVIFFLYRWKRPAYKEGASESVGQAIRSGMQYMRGSSAVKSVLVRTVAFSFSAAALLALLPLIARPYGAVGYGLLLGLFGAGAIAGAILMPRVRRKTSVDGLVSGATLIFAAVTFGSGQADRFSSLCAIVFVAGVAWIGILACLNIAAQTMTPPWVRARALSVYLLALQGGMAAGSALWGELASSFGLPVAMSCAGLGLVAGLLTRPKFPLLFYHTTFDHAVAGKQIGTPRN
jgi:MFS family permease